MTLQAPVKYFLTGLWINRDAFSRILLHLVLYSWFCEDLNTKQKLGWGACLKDRKIEKGWLFSKLHKIGTKSCMNVEIHRDFPLWLILLSAKFEADIFITTWVILICKLKKSKIQKNHVKYFILLQNYGKSRKNSWK